MVTEQVQLGYSPKNIPLSNECEYRQCLIKKTKSFLKAVTWAATFFLKKSKPSFKETYGFKSSFEPKRLPELRKFEDKMLDLVQNIKFREKQHHISEFQKKLNENIKEVKINSKLYVKGDKTINYYTMSREV